MDEIDRMDMPGFLKLRAWNAGREQKNENLADGISTRSGKM